MRWSLHAAPTLSRVLCEIQRATRRHHRRRAHAPFQARDLHASCASACIAGEAPASGLADFFDLDVGSESKEAKATEAVENERKESLARKNWKATHELRGHFDGVQALAFHRTQLQLASASEDMTVKYWDLAGAASSKHSDKSPVEPLVTYRGHRSPVLATAISSAGRLFTADSSGLLNSWAIPAVGGEPLPPHDPSMLLDSNTEHTDAVWVLDVNQDDTTLMSAGADGKCCLWDTSSGTLALKCTIVSEFGAIGSGGFVAADDTKFVLGHANGQVSIHDATTGDLISSMSRPLGEGEGIVAAAPPALLFRFSAGDAAAQQT